ncbi:hypothetical protein EUGRSUZ_E00557 [Eucalyptus grandis]|uniref:Uncharacterized protein n=2 Tax=Eucalyptus grandis TaxID=71139 RepID=A0ACC3KRU2_EUCGR|nr:hypothetical protein EUGRSUZ_E00557 [Eucalyptus grandis]
MRSFTNLSIPSFFFLLISCSTLARAARFDVTNNCPYTVWAAAVPGGGRQLDQGQTWPLDVAAGTTEARIWARTNCRFDGAGQGSCETGDCGGLLQCQAYGVSPNTLAEFSLNQYMNQDFIDMSLIEGFNVPMEFSSTSGECNRTDEYCCNSGSCGPTDYSRYFKDRCPDAYSYPKDDATSVFTCPGGTNYKVVFCP